MRREKIPAQESASAMSAHTRQYLDPAGRHRQKVLTWQEDIRQYESLVGANHQKKTGDKDNMVVEQETIDIVANIFAQAIKKTLEKSTKKTIKFSTTFQAIPQVSLKPEVGSFVMFFGDYNGLVIMNFSAEAAMDLYRSYMLNMGLPESDLAKEFTSNDVIDTMGEMTNQMMGRAMSMVESKFDLTSYCGQPKALSLNNAITLTPDMNYQSNRRVSFAIGTSRFHMELAMEQTEFVLFSS